jgi:hypothetical protein
MELLRVIFAARPTRRCLSAGGLIPFACRQSGDEGVSRVSTNSAEAM